MHRMQRLRPMWDFRWSSLAEASAIPRRTLQLHWLRLLCRDYLEPARREWGECHVQSGFRSTQHNADVGGAPRSMHRRIAHRRGAAADVASGRAVR
jgi:hypothetical protein